MAIKLHGKIIGKLDQIRIYYYVGATLFRYSFIEEWVVNSLAQNLFGKDNTQEFTDNFRSLSFGQKLQYLRGEDVKDRFSHTSASIATLELLKQCSEYQDLYAELNRVCTERNQLIHTSYFQGAREKDWKMRFSSWRPLKKKGEFVNEDVTPGSARMRYKSVLSDWKLLQDLNVRLTVCFVKKVQELETLSNQNLKSN